MFFQLGGQDQKTENVVFAHARLFQAQLVQLPKQKMGVDKKTETLIEELRFLRYNNHKIKFLYNPLSPHIFEDI